MAHQNFEKYAIQRLMNGCVSDVYRDFFNINVEPLLNRNGMVLDFGCGDGKYFVFFSALLPEQNIYGAEISKTRVNRCSQMGWNNVRLIERLQPLPFPDGFFDFINFDQVIEHINGKEIHFYLAELRRVLKDGGMVLVVTPNYPVKHLYDFYSALQRRDMRKIFDDPTHVSKYGFTKLKSVLSTYFKILVMSPTGGILWNKSKKDFLSHKIIALVSK